MSVSQSSAILRRFKAPLAILLCFVVSAAVMAYAAEYVYRSGCTLCFGDAEAHLDIARRVFDSRTPGWYQLGTTWLPLPHLLMIPLVKDDWYWKTGMAGVIPAVAAMTLAATFFFAAMQRLFGAMAAAAGTAVLLLNPNTLYLGSIPMTEPIFFACAFAMLYFLVRWGETAGWGAVAGAAIAACAGTLTRYDGWVLLPLAALWILLGGRKRKRWKRAAQTVLFCAIAGAGPALWLAHNRYYYSDAVYFYRGPYSALAIQKDVPYPGRGDWKMAAQVYFEAARLIAGWPALILGAAGIVLAAARRVLWPVLLLALPCAFYVWNVHSGGTPIYVPTLVRGSWYNTRYAIAVLPLVGLGVAAIGKMRWWAGLAAAAIAFAPLALHPNETNIVRQESEINSRVRRDWTARTARYLSGAIDAHDTIVTSFGDMTGIFRTMGFPLRRTLTGNNDLQWALATSRPEIFLHEDWAVVTGGDTIQTIISRFGYDGPRYELEDRIIVKGATPIEIYRRAPDPVPTDDATAEPQNQ